MVVAEEAFATFAILDSQSCLVCVDVADEPGGGVASAALADAPC